MVTFVFISLSLFCHLNQNNLIAGRGVLVRKGINGENPLLCYWFKMCAIRVGLTLAGTKPFYVEKI